jgi:hypothetical protein
MDTFKPVDEPLPDSTSDDAAPIIEGEVKVSDLNAIGSDDKNSTTSTKSDKKKKATKTVKKADGSKPKKLRHSNWFITVNTNKRMVDPDDPEMMDIVLKLKQALEKFMQTSVLGGMLKFTWEGTGWTQQFVKKVHPINPSIEVGHVHGCIHAHFRLSIDHWCNIQLDLKKVPAFFKEELGKGTWISIKRYTSDKDVDEYIKKDNLPEVNVEVTSSIDQPSTHGA